jgi:hypothetical protein
LMLGAASAQAQTTLAAWEVNGLSAYGPSPFAAATTGANVTIGGLTRGSGVTTTPTAAGSAWGGNGWDGNATASAAIAANDFATFSVTANSGYSVSFSTIPAYNIRRSSSGPTTGQWQYQVGSGSFVDIGSPITWGSTTSGTGNAQGAINLSGITALQNVSAGTTVTFRIVNYNASAGSGTWYINNIAAGNDLQIQGTVAPISPVISTTGNPSAVNGIFGSPSSYTTTQFTVSGADMTEGVTVTPPTGFEVSQTSSSSGYASSLVVGASGAFGPVTVYVRLNASASVGNYSGNIVLTSSGATTVNVVMPNSAVQSTGASTIAVTGSTLFTYNGIAQGPDTSTVTGSTGAVTYCYEGINGTTYSPNTTKPTDAGSYRVTATVAADANYLAASSSADFTIDPANITITADDVNKSFGSTLTGGAGFTQFAVSGALVSGQTIGTVTITYGVAGGAAAAVGTYAGQVTPSSATGGTFNPANYNITYVAGDIFVIAPFSPGNLVLEQIGNGSTALGSSALPVAVLEFEADGTPVQTVNLPSTGDYRLTDSGTGTSAGHLNSYGAYLAVPGYNSAVGTAGVSSLNTKVTHILGFNTELESRVEHPTSAPTPFLGESYRSVIPLDASTFYASGNGGGTSGGIWYFDGTDFIQVSTTVNNARNLDIYNGQLYFATGATANRGIYAVGSGLPTTTGQTSALMIDTGSASSPYGFAISPDGNTAYIADERAIASGGGIQKWILSESVWSLAYTFGTGDLSTVGARGLAVDFSDPDPVIYATTAEASLNRLIKITDTGASSVVTTLSTAGSNFIYRGLDFTPEDGAPPATPFTSFQLTTRGTATFDGSNTTVTHTFTGTPNATGIFEYKGELTDAAWTGTSEVSSNAEGVFTLVITSPGNLTTNWNGSMFFRIQP